MMPNLHAEFTQFVLKRNRTQSPLTRKDRLKILRLFADELAMLGYKNLSIVDLEEHHVHDLIALWQQQKIAAGTLRNRLTTLRWWACSIDKKHVVSPDNSSYGVLREPLGYRYEKHPKITPKTEAEVVKAAGKICAKCVRIRPANEFCEDSGMKDGYVNVCNGCRSAEVARYDLQHREQKHAYDAAHKLERRLRDLAREHGLSGDDPRLFELNALKPKRSHDENIQKAWTGKPRKPRAKIEGSWVYIIQICGQANVIKIGHTTSLLKRITALHNDYGGVEVIMALPYENSSGLERTLHQYFNEMRIYANGAASELFRFETRKKQRVLERFLVEFSSFSLAPIRWENTQENLRAEQDTCGQMALFSPKGLTS